jgi:hypothetical protein
METIMKEQALARSSHALVWRAVLRTGEVMWEWPGVSSDHLPADSVVQIDYVPRREDLPTIEAHIDLARGERFVRYWTTIWRPTGGGTAMLYVLGVQQAGRYALLCYYPHFNKVVLAAERPFQPSWTPRPFDLLPPDAVSVGGPGSAFFGWRYRGFGGLVEVMPDNRITFRAVYDDDG